MIKNQNLMWVFLYCSKFNWRWVIVITVIVTDHPILLLMLVTLTPLRYIFAQYPIKWVCSEDTKIKFPKVPFVLQGTVYLTELR